ncbi:hypothetical protein GCM10027028_47970 [Streptomyces sundarbansensis]
MCPGFIDTHVHFARPGPGENAALGIAEPVTHRVLKVLERLRMTLHKELTTARDLMDPDAGFSRGPPNSVCPDPGSWSPSPCSLRTPARPTSASRRQTA